MAIIEIGRQAGLPAITASDWATLNDLVGKAMLYDDTCSQLLKQRTRVSILKKAGLPLNLWLRLTSFEDAKDIYEFAARVIALFGPPETML